MDYKFTLVFSYQDGKPMYFTYKILNNRYEIFYGIVNNFFCCDLHESHLDEILYMYPKLKNKILDENNEYRTTNLNQIFDRKFFVNSVTYIGNTEYKIEWYA